MTPRPFARAWRAYVRTLEVVVAGLLTVVIVTTFANVVRRYIGFGTFSWADESSRRLLLWMTFFGAALAVVRASHLRIDSVVNGADGRVGQTLTAIIGIAAFVFFALLLIGGGQFAISTLDRVTPAMAISTAWTTSAVPAGGLLMFISFIGRLRFGVLPPMFADTATAAPRTDAPDDGDR